MKKTVALLLAALITTLSAVPLKAASGSAETVIVLSDAGITVNGSAASANSSSDVYVGANIVYYEAGHDSSYGEGTSADEHSASEAAAHTVVTVTKAGTYRLTGTLSAGQIAVNLGENASGDQAAVVTLILDDVNVTCTVAPAIIFYNVYECGGKDTATASATVDTSKAGANVIIADGSVNNVNGSYVARIYVEGTTKKLHKYDGAFYSKMSMNVSGGSAGNGVLNIVASNEGLDSELHLTINGGVININAQDDGINTNEDGVSVTTINGGTLYVNGGFGSEGDGIDSNGFLVINGGTVIATANPRTGDGGIDADGDILINGGTVIALGSRNDAASTNSRQAYIELMYASTQTAGTMIRIQDANGNEILTFYPPRDYQSVTVSSSKLVLGTTYHLYSGGTVTGTASTNGLYTAGGSYTGGTQQQYTATGMTGGSGGGMGGMTRPDGEAAQLDGTERPEGERPQLNGTTPPEGEMPQFDGNGRQGQAPPDGTMPQFDGNQRTESIDGAGTPPDNFGQTQGNAGSQTAAAADGSVDFTLTSSLRSFSGISAATAASGKTAVTFTVNNGNGMENVNSGGIVTISGITATTRSGESAAITGSDIQITITDVPSENYAKSCLLSEGSSVIAAILPTADGTYQLTVSVLSSNAAYTGTTQWMFSIGGDGDSDSDTPFTDVEENNAYYDAIMFVYNAGLMSGTGNNTFSPNVSVSRSMAITVLGLLANAETVESDAFTDVEAGSWYAAYVGWSQKNGVVTGYGNGMFGPNDSVTRQQMCVILYNYAKSAGITMKTTSLSYTDESKIADWAYEAVKACKASGLLDKVASGTALNPDAALTRAELADMLMRFAQYLENYSNR